MTTWIAHLRVAENLPAELGAGLDVASFAAGSVGPHSGLPTNAEGTQFDPPKAASAPRTSQPTLTPRRGIGRGLNTRDTEAPREKG